ncbi:MAG: thermonuclease family protein [Candidatus Aenigmarchaeota archaeon]|nr:thermonuclease family protein [Candidatus Aenigmarchaeota archaeon]
MTSKIPVFVIILVVGLVIFMAIYYVAQSEREVGYVTRVIDGDTIELNTSEKVRFLGINTPEKGEPFYAEAKERLEQLVKNKKIYMEKDKVENDKYGRLLRYIYLEDDMVNLKMIEEGYANVYMLKPNYAHERLFRSAEEVAIDSRLGIWSLVSEDRCSPCIIIKEFNWDAEGNDCQNPNGEWVSFKNICNFDCDLTAWSVKDEGRKIYMFPSFILSPKSSVKLLSGPGTDIREELYWNNKGSCKAVWNNDGDTLYLRDSENRFVLREYYSVR